MGRKCNKNSTKQKVSFYIGSHFPLNNLKSVINFILAINPVPQGQVHLAIAVTSPDRLKPEEVIDIVLAVLNKE